MMNTKTLAISVLLALTGYANAASAFVFAPRDGVDHVPTSSPAGSSPAAIIVEASDTESGEILRCIGRKLEALLPETQKPFLISVGSFKHAGLTGALTPQELCVDCTTAVESAVAQISPLVNYTDVGRRTPAAAAGEPKVDVFLEGSILFQEKVPKSSSSSVDVSVGFARFLDIAFGYKMQDSQAAMSMDMNGLLRGRISGYRLTAPLRITFDRSAARQISIAGSIADLAIGTEHISRRVTSFEQALRLGVAHQLAQIIGRWQYIPGYWSCTNGEPDEEVKKERLKHFRLLRTQLGEAAAIGYLQDLLAYNGHLLEERTQQLDESTAAALSSFMEHRGQRFDPDKLEIAYWELILGVVDQSEAVLEAARAWEKRTAKQASFSPQTQSAPTPAQDKKPRRAKKT